MGGYFEQARQLAIAQSEQRIEEILVKTPVNLESLVGFYNYFSKKWDLETDTIDLVGTGGDKKNTFNISTASAILLAGMGVSVTKFGNKAASSNSGSMDVLEQLGISTVKNESELKTYLEQSSIAFISARDVYTEFSKFGAVRKRIAKPTILNYLGPLLNPVKNSCTVLGAYDSHFVNLYLQVFERVGKTKGAIINGHGFDEAIPFHETHITHFNGEEYAIGRYKFGNEEVLETSGPEHSAKIILDIFNVKDKSSRRDCVILNAAIAYSVFTNTKFDSSYLLARKALDSGKAMRVVENLRDLKI